MKLYEDVRDLTAVRLRDDLGYLPSVVVGSPPCQDASCANTAGRGVDGERTGLFFEAVRLVAEVRPAWACFENVPGIRTRGIDRILAEMEALNYACWPLVVGAFHAGAPHRRQRVWIVAADTSRGSGAAKPSRGVAHRAADTARGGPRVDCARPDTDGGGRLREPERYVRSETGIETPSGHDPFGPAVGADALGVGLAIGPRERGDPCEELPPALRTVAERSDWNGGAAGLAGSMRVVDGLSAGVARRCIAAYGDAVVPQIPEAIGRAMSGVVPTDGTVLDLFCGAAGGWSLGLHRAGYRTVAACEIDPWRRETFARRWA